jgi:toxin ParE1/3/4
VVSVRLQSAARRDLAQILEYSIDEFGRGVADAYFSGFEEAFAGLKVHPRKAPFFGRISPPIRCLIYRSHRIFYDIEGDKVWIRRILHKSMDARSHLI